jgi:hypothetical protein
MNQQPPVSETIGPIIDAVSNFVKIIISQTEILINKIVSGK